MSDTIFGAVLIFVLITVSVVMVCISIKEHYELKDKFAKRMQEIDQMGKRDTERIRAATKKTEDLRVKLAEEREKAMQIPKFRMIR